MVYVEGSMTNLHVQFPPALSYLKRFVLAFGVLLVCFFGRAPVLAQVILEEPPDLPDTADLAAPNLILEYFGFSFTGFVSGRLDGATLADGSVTGDTRDAFAFVVPAGRVVRNVRVVLNFVFGANEIEIRARSPQRPDAIAPALLFQDPVIFNGQLQLLFAGAALHQGTYDLEVSATCPTPSRMECVYLILFDVEPLSADFCSAAMPMTVGTFLHGFDFDFTTWPLPDGPPTLAPLCPSVPIDLDFWYSFVAPMDGTLRVRTCSRDRGRPAIALYAGTNCENLEQRLLSCSSADDFVCELPSATALTIGKIVESPFRAGESALFRIGSADNRGNICSVITVDFIPGLPPPPCPADFDNNHVLTTADIFAFLDAWFLLEQRADFNASGDITPQDIFDFLNAWFIGNIGC